jgi:hypothetical protein
VTTLDATRNESGHTWPQFLLDGRKFLYYVFTEQQESSGIYLGFLDSKQRRQLVSAASNAAYAPPTDSQRAYLLFARGTTLLAQPFDDDARLTGEPSLVAENLGYYEGFRIADSSVSQNGVWHMGVALFIRRHNSSGLIAKANN